MKYPSGYGIVFKKVLCDPSIRVEVKAVYALLAAYTGQDDVCWPSIPTMAKSLNCSDQSIRNWCKELEEAGWLKVARSDRSSNEYELQVPPQPGYTPRSTPVDPPRSTPVDPTINILTSNNDNSLQPPFLGVRADPKPVKIPKKTEKALKKVSERTEITDYYQELFVKEYGAKPTWDGRIMKLVDADLARLGADLLGELIWLFFDRPTSFVEKNGTGKGYNIFHCQIDTLLERRTRMKKNA